MFLLGWCRDWFGTIEFKHTKFETKFEKIKRNDIIMDERTNKIDGTVLVIKLISKIKAKFYHSR